MYKFFEYIIFLVFMGVAAFFIIGGVGSLLHALDLQKIPVGSRYGWNDPGLSFLVGAVEIGLGLMRLATTLALSGGKRR